MPSELVLRDGDGAGCSLAALGNRRLSAPLEPLVGDALGRVALDGALPTDRRPGVPIQGMRSNLNLTVLTLISALTQRALGIPGQLVAGDGRPAA